MPPLPPARDVEVDSRTQPLGIDRATEHHHDAGVETCADAVTFSRRRRGTEALEPFRRRSHSLTLCSTARCRGQPGAGAQPEGRSLLGVLACLDGGDISEM